MFLVVVLEIDQKALNFIFASIWLIVSVLEKNEKWILRPGAWALKHEIIALESESFVFFSGEEDFY